MDVDTGMDQEAQGLSLRPESPMKTSEDSKPRPGTIGSRDAVVQIFEAFHVELDAHHDRRERLIKVCTVRVSEDVEIIIMLLDEPRHHEPLEEGHLPAAQARCAEHLQLKFQR